MTHLTDVNTSDIEDAVRLGCHCMCNMFDADDGDVPYFRVVARPDAFLGIPLIEHVPGRHLNALLNAEDVVEVAIDEEAIDKHARVAFLSYCGPLPLSLGRQDGAGPPRMFVPHHVREGFHALYALVEFRGSLRARDLAEASIQTILDYWNPETEWDAARLEQQGIVFNDSGTFISGVARTIGPLVKYYRSTGHAAALELALLLKEKAIGRYFTADGSYDRELFGTHAHSVTCTMSSLAQLADLTVDTPLMNRVKAFYDNGLFEMRDGIGWSIEDTSPESNRPDEGEMNNTGDILETALILGRWGYTEYYHDAERILRCHLLPSQLRDVSWIEAPANPDGVDALTDVAGRIRGSFGFPAPFGHGPLEQERMRFNTDVVGGAVGSLCEALREATRFDATGHRVNLLFDRETRHLKIESPYTHPTLSVRVKTPAPLFVRLPPWVDVAAMRLEGVEGELRMANGYLFVAEPPLNRPITIAFELPTEEIVLAHRTREIKARLRGDEVAAMESFGADLTFFEPL